MVVREVKYFMFYVVYGFTQNLTYRHFLDSFVTLSIPVLLRIYRPIFTAFTEF
jgi:hypothetical protein